MPVTKYDPTKPKSWDNWPPVHPLAWAPAIVEKHERGEFVSIHVLAMAREVINAHPWLRLPPSQWLHL